MKTPLIASAITTAISLYILRSQDTQTQIGISTAVDFGTYYAMSQISDEVSKATKHVDINPTTNCSYQDVEHSGQTYACVM